MDSKHQSENKTRVKENRERYYLHVRKKSPANSLSKKQAQTTTKQSTRSISVRLLMQLEIYWRVKRVLTQCIEDQQDGMSGKWESSVAAEHTTMPWTIRMAASENSTHFTIHVGKNNPRALKINKLKTINENDKIFTVLNRDNGDYVTTNSWKAIS